MSDKAWKANERQIASALGGKRVPVTGRARGDAPDIETPHELACEIKLRRRLPAWLHEAMSQAEAAARDQETPVAILREHGQPTGQAFVVVRLDDFKRFLGA